MSAHTKLIIHQKGPINAKRLGLTCVVISHNQCLGRLHTFCLAASPARLERAHFRLASARHFGCGCIPDRRGPAPPKDKCRVINLSGPSPTSPSFQGNHWFCGPLARASTSFRFYWETLLPTSI